MGEAVTEVEAGAKANAERAGDVELLVLSLLPWLGLSVLLSLSVLLTVVRAGGSVVGRRDEVVAD